MMLSASLIDAQQRFHPMGLIFARWPREKLPLGIRSFRTKQTRSLSKPLAGM